METKQSMDCILKDPNAKSNKPVIPRLITVTTKIGIQSENSCFQVNPLNIIIESKSGQIDKTLELNCSEINRPATSFVSRNIYPCRVAFRIQTNGPTRYTVCPNKGFLSIGEKSMIQITMIDGNKYQSNHQFIVQAMPAPGDFADRKLIWKQPNYLGILTNTRVKTMRPGQPLSKPRSKSPSGLTTPIDNSGMNSPAVMDSNESLVTPSAPSWTAPVSSIDHGKYADKINDLASQVKKAIAEKNTRASEMVSVVNQIKSIEVELDRQAQLVNEMSDRVKKGELQYSNLVLHERTIRSDLERMKNNEMDPSGP